MILRLLNKFRRQEEPVVRLPKGPGRLDPNSPTWVFVENWANERIDSLRVDNDRPHDEKKTASIRGKIEAFKELKGIVGKPEEEYGLDPFQIDPYTDAGY